MTLIKNKFSDKNLFFGLDKINYCQITVVSKNETLVSIKKCCS